jgi:hypothetical protein
MWGDSNTRRAYRTLSGLLNATDPARGGVFSAWCGARRNNPVCTCEDHYENYIPPQPTPALNVTWVWIDLMPRFPGAASVEYLNKTVSAAWTGPKMLPVISFGNWELAYA